MNLSRRCPWSQAFVVTVFFVLAAPEVAAAVCRTSLPPVRIQLPASGSPPLLVESRDFDCGFFTLSEVEPWLSVNPSSGGPGLTPVAFTFDANAVEPGYYPGVVEMSAGVSRNFPQHFTVGFRDVPGGIFDRFIHAAAGARLTAGCGDKNFCPNAPLTRAQLAVWLLRSKLGPYYTASPATGLVFSDVGATSLAAGYIEELRRFTIAFGCSSTMFCPDRPVTRGELAVLLLRTLESSIPCSVGISYTPPPATGIFDDVPAANPFAPWIEEMFERGISGGCSASPALFCPDRFVTRGEAAVFMVAAFNLPIAPQ